MPSGPASILGGLPVIADVWYTRGDGWETDDDAGVDALYWMKRDGSKGKPLPQHMFDRLEKSDPYWECAVVDAVFDHLSYEAWEREQINALVMFIAIGAYYAERRQ